MLDLEFTTHDTHLLFDNLVVHVKRAWRDALFLDIKAPLRWFFLRVADFLNLLDLRLFQINIIEFIFEVREEEDVSLVASSPSWWLMLVALIKSCRVDLREDVNVSKHTQLL